MIQWIRDWWRGWSQDDLESIMAKIDMDKNPGGITYVTEREMRALHANPFLTIK